jgi:hypothetical protein
MHRKPAMTFLKYPVYLHGKITMTYLKLTFVWQHYLYHLEKNYRISKLPLPILQKVKGKTYGQGNITCKRTIPEPRV